MGAALPFDHRTAGRAEANLTESCGGPLPVETQLSQLRNAQQHLRLMRTIGIRPDPVGVF